MGKLYKTNHSVCVHERLLNMSGVECLSWKKCVRTYAFRFCWLQESNLKIAALTKSLAKLDPDMVPKVDLEQHMVEGRLW